MARSFSFKVDLTAGDGVVSNPILVSGDDTMYYRFVSEGASAPSTAVLSAFTRRHIDEPGLSVGALTIDGTAASLSLTGVELISFGVTTTEAAKLGTLYIQTRKTQE